MMFLFYFDYELGIVVIVVVFGLYWNIVVVCICCV